MDGITLNAYAKINLSLAVIDRRADGYHNIKSLMQGIDLCDVIRLSKCLKNGTKYNLPHCTIHGVVVYLCTDAKTIPADMSNLAFRGIKAVLDACADSHRADVSGDLRDGLIIELDKRLPVAAGIAGGSDNAAACMLGINALIGSPFSLRELMDIGTGVGADVPFSLMMNAKRNADELAGLEGLVEARSAAWVSGIGEIVEPAEPMRRHVIMVNPGIAVSTGAAYEALDSVRRERSPEELEHPMFMNDFEANTLSAYPEAGRLSRLMREELRADTVLMSGSGPTMIGYYEDPAAASCDFDRMKEICVREGSWRAWLTETGNE